LEMNVNWDLVDRLRGWEGWDRLHWNVSVEILVRGGLISHHPLGSERLAALAILCIFICKQVEVIG
jgi:hypothetical protein